MGHSNLFLPPTTLNQGTEAQDAKMRDADIRTMAALLTKRKPHAIIGAFTSKGFPTL